MKNLKKVLALGLALVMLLGMFTFASAAETKKVASDLTDWADVNPDHKDAVALMVDLGIIGGKPDGSFAPTEGIDRASWAKMVYYAATGSDDADAYLGTASKLKDIKGNWAESYISYLAAQKYVSGDTEGNYKPSSNVTVAEGAKMLLCVLGYDAEDRGYQNSEFWSGNIMTDAKKFGLMDDIDAAQTALVPLTRENAAHMIVNALDAEVVEATRGRDNGEKYVQRYTGTGDKLGWNSFNLSKVTTVVTGVNADGTANFDGSTVVPDGKVKATLADVGKTVNVFVKLNSSKTFKSLVSTAVTSANVEPKKTITGGVEFTTKAANIWVKGDDDYLGVPVQKGDNGEVDVSVYRNGNSITYASLADVAAGNVVELYTNDDGEVEIIKIVDYKVAKVGDIKTKTEKDVEKVLVTNVTGGKYVPKDQISGLTGVAKDDIVLYCDNDSTGDDAVITIEKLSPVSGKVTNVSSKGKITVGGAEYAKSSLSLPGSAMTDADNATFSSWGNYDDEYALYTDKNGDVCWITKLTDESVGSDIAVVLDASWVTGSGIKGSNYLEAELLFADGTTEVVTVSKIGKDSAGKVVFDKVASTDLTGLAAQDKLLEYVPGKTTATFVSYKVDKDGKYEITALTAQTADYASAETIAAGTAIEAKLQFASGATKANNKTVFVIAKGNDDDGYEYSTVTGHTNVPAINDADFVAGFINAKSGDPAKYVFLKAKAFADDTPDGYVFVKSTDFNTNASKDRVYEIVDATGADETMTIDATKATSVITAIGWYQIKSITDGVVGDIEAVSAQTGTLSAVGGGAVTLGDGTAFAYDSATVCVVVDIKDNGDYDSVSAISVDDLALEDDYFTYTASVIGKPDSDPIDYLYVTRTAKSAPTGDEA